MEQYEEFSPSQHHRKPWALIVTVLVVILFGAFWYYERTHTNTVTPVVIPVAQPSEPSLSDLQAAAINTSIPDLSDSF